MQQNTFAIKIIRIIAGKIGVFKLCQRFSEIFDFYKNFISVHFYYQTIKLSLNNQKFCGTSSTDFSPTGYTASTGIGIAWGLIVSFSPKQARILARVSSLGIVLLDSILATED